MRCTLQPYAQHPATLRGAGDPITVRRDARAALVATLPHPLDGASLGAHRDGELTLVRDRVRVRVRVGARVSSGLIEMVS